MGKLMEGLSIVIPVYNSELSLPILVKEINQALSAKEDPFEIILVNDGSRDDSWKVIEQICQTYDYITAFDLSRNFGQHNALLCGIRKAKYDIIVTMDDDLQHPPTEIPILVNMVRGGKDLVYGTPKRETHSLWRNISSNFVKWALKISTGIPYAGKISAFRAFRTELRETFSNYSSPYTIIDVLLSWGTTKIGYIEVEHHKREIGQSQYSFRKLLGHALRIIVGFSVLPLRIASILGFLFTFFGFVILAYVLIRYLTLGGAVPGFSFLASMIAVFSGIILFIMGISGEYIAMLYTNMLAKPQYMINRSVSHK